MDFLFADECYKDPIFFEKTDKYVYCNLPRILMFVYLILVLIVLISLFQGLKPFFISFFICLIIGAGSYFGGYYYYSSLHKNALDSLKNFGYDGTENTIQSARLKFLDERQKRVADVERNETIKTFGNVANNLINNLFKK